MAVAEYDYIVVGAGTAGLSLATRLAQADKSVLVLEAGKDSSEAAEINVPGFFMKNIGHPDRDWAFFSQPQAHANSRAVFLPRGKGVGGTSVLNFIQWNRSLETLGLEGWNWKNMLHYFKRSETLVAPESAQEATLLKLDPEAHGTSGPIIVAPPTQISSVHLPFLHGFKELGFQTNYDSVNNLGAWTSLANIDPADATRSSSASVYLKLKPSLPHLEVIPSAHVARIVFAEGTSADGLVTAIGVEYIKDGEKRFAKATKEVIVSGGAYQTPQVLELSGIGNKELLEKHGIKPVVDLPGVGENLRGLSLVVSF
ncbi:glucose-methanol-choline oxidoreductase [Schizophyllum commune]